MLRRKLLFGFAALSILALGQSAQAGFSNFAGGLPIQLLGTIGSDTGNINTATMITIPGMGYTGGASGDFATYVPTPGLFAPPTIVAGTTTTISGLNPLLAPGASAAISFSFGSLSGIGTFVASSYTILMTGPNTQAYEFLGTFTTGSDFAGDPNAGSGQASYILNLTQSSSGSPISGSATLNVPPVPTVPEPASVAMLGLGLVGVAGLGLRRRSVK